MYTISCLKVTTERAYNFWQDFSSCISEYIFNEGIKRFKFVFWSLCKNGIESYHTKLGSDVNADDASHT